MITHRLSGTYYEMGLELGKKIGTFFQIPPISKEAIYFAQECSPIVENYCPEIIKELEGLAEGLGIDLLKLEGFILALGKDMMEESKEMMAQGIDFGCTSFAICEENTSERGPLFGRNYDWLESFAPYFTVTYREPEGGIPNISFTDHPIGNYGGVNKEGLAISIHGVPEYEPEWVPGIRMNIISRWILDMCTNTKEALRFFEEIPHICGHNYLIADHNNDLARIETAAEDIVITEPENGFIVSTNHAISPQMKKYCKQTFIFDLSVERYNRIVNWYTKSQGMISTEMIKHILSDHEEGVCNHFEYGGEMTSTIWSWIAVLGSSIIEVCDGAPCKNEYSSMKL